MFWLTAIHCIDSLWFIALIHFHSYLISFHSFQCTIHFNQHINSFEPLQRRILTRSLFLCYFTVWLILILWLALILHFDSFCISASVNIKSRHSFILIHSFDTLLIWLILIQCVVFFFYLINVFILSCCIDSLWFNDSILTNSAFGESFSLCAAIHLHSWNWLILTDSSVAHRLVVVL